METEAPDTPTSADEAPTGAEDKQDTFDADYVAKLRKENAKYRTEAKANAEAAAKLREIEESGKTEAQKLAEELEQLRGENTTLKLATTKAQIAASKGVPAELLSGSTEEELEASAEALLAFKGKESAPDYGAGKRGKPVDGPAQLTREDLAGMTTEQINAARKEGRLDRIMGRVP